MYTLYIEEQRIGSTELEHHDAPMGVVFGEIDFPTEVSPFAVILHICKVHSVKINTLDEENHAIFTSNIEALKVINDSGVEVPCLAKSISGSNEMGFEIEIIGIPYPFYEAEFPQHVADYAKLNKDQGLG